MNSTKAPTKTTNPILNSILVFSVGLSALEFTLLIFNPSQAIRSITSLEFDSILLEMFEGMFLSADTLGSFWAVLVAWGISGLVAGVRAKIGTWGAIAGFFGTLGGAGFLASLNIASLSGETIPKFGMGAVACIIIACISAYATGNATKEKPRKAKKVRTRKVWHESKTKEVWSCNRCGDSIPPGAFTCPKCGEPVIE
ncbi:MAG: hypothetical protein ACW97X_10260 [Candidatus Hodarchaeales archaeon]|jgi:hypothetical protein